MVKQMECMILESGGIKYYVDKSIIEGFLGEPELFSVPGSKEEIAGISMYQRKPVLYYNLAQIQSTTSTADVMITAAVSNPEKTDDNTPQSALCGVILRGGGRWLHGVIGRVSGEASVPESKLSPVHPGVWELQSDSTK